MLQYISIYIQPNNTKNHSPLTKLSFHRAVVFKPANNKEIDMEIFILLIGIALIVYSIYKWGTLTYDYWKLRNVKFPKTSWLFGNSGEFMRAKQSLINYSILLYQAYPSEK